MARRTTTFVWGGVGFAVWPGMADGGRGAKWVVSLDSVSGKDADRFGGKARGLITLARAGFTVPPAFLVSVQAFEWVTRRTSPSSPLGRNVPQWGSGYRLQAHSTEKSHGRFRERVFALSLPSGFVSELERAFHELSEDGAGVAVRSSATVEDGEGGSAAGLFTSELNVTDLEGLWRAVREVWASAHAPHVLRYCAQLGLGGVQMGVVLQRMVASEVSGVMFTRDPVSEQAQAMVIHANYGLALSMVDGASDGDVYWLSHASGAIVDRVQGKKETGVVPRVGGGVVTVAHSGLMRATWCLERWHLHQLHGVAQRIERTLGGPQDVEWCFVRGQLHILQSRSITSPSKIVDEGNTPFPVDGVWTRANVGEALPGVVTPMTWSLVERVSAPALRSAFGSLGISVPEGQPVLRSVRGRLYLNMGLLAKRLRQVPGVNAHTLTRLGGGDSTLLDGDDSFRPSFRFPLAVLGGLRVHAGLSRRRDGWLSEVERFRAHFEGVPLAAISPQGLRQWLNRAVFLLSEGASVLFVTYGRLVAVSWLHLRASGGFHFGGDTLEGLRVGELQSAEPTRALRRLATLVARYPATVTWLRDGAPGELVLGRCPDEDVRRAVRGFVQAHGHGGEWIAEVASPRWAEDPSVILRWLRLEVLRPATAGDGAKMATPQRSADDGNPLGHGLRRQMRLREQLRGEVNRLLWAVRRLCLEVGQRLSFWLDGFERDDVFMLRFEEVLELLEEGASRGWASMLVRRRRLQYTRDLSLPEPPHTFRGVPPQGTNTNDSEPVTRLTGLGTGHGRVEGRARVVQSISELERLEHDEVLVVSRADSSWAPWVDLSRGFVTELGGPLSHLAIIARELGVVSVMNVQGATRRIRTGDRIALDGRAGTVEVLGRAARA